jgi:large subunit ribosomal protein L37Ae
LGPEDPSSNLGSPIYANKNDERIKMVKKEKYTGSTKRFGTRYGRTLKRRLEEIEKVQKSKQKCPYCHNLKVKRLSLGIWFCEKCKAKFTGKAYSLKKIVKETEEEKKVEKVEEEEEPEEEVEDSEEDQ